MKIEDVIDESVLAVFQRRGQVGPVLVKAIW